MDVKETANVMKFISLQVYVQNGGEVSSYRRTEQGINIYQCLLQFLCVVVIDHFVIVAPLCVLYCTVMPSL